MLNFTTNSFQSTRELAVKTNNIVSRRKCRNYFISVQKLNKGLSKRSFKWIVCIPVCVSAKSNCKCLSPIKSNALLLSKLRMKLAVLKGLRRHFIQIDFWLTLWLAPLASVCPDSRWIQHSDNTNGWTWKTSSEDMAMLAGRTKRIEGTT